MISVSLDWPFNFSCIYIFGSIIGTLNLITSKININRTFKASLQSKLIFPYKQESKFSKNVLWKPCCFTIIESPFEKLHPKIYLYWSWLLKSSSIFITAFSIILDKSKVLYYSLIWNSDSLVYSLKASRHRG